MHSALPWVVFLAAVSFILWSYAEPALAPIARVVAAAMLTVTTVNLLRSYVRKGRGLPKT